MMDDAPPGEPRLPRHLPPDFHACPVCGGVLWLERFAEERWPMHREGLVPAAPVCAASGRMPDEALALGKRL